MKPLIKDKRAIAHLVIGLALTGCSAEILDFRNAEISNNKLYSRGDNSPFSGNVTNMPLNKMPAGKIGQLVQLVSAATKDDSFRALLLTNSLIGVLGKNEAGIL